MIEQTLKAFCLVVDFYCIAKKETPRVTQK